MRLFISVFRFADRASFVARLITLISLCAAPSLAAENTTVERRFALVIGNNAYKESPLANAANDAESMGAALSRVGFEVTVLKDAPLKVMQETIVDFGNRLKNGGIGLFYYAGHGIQVRGVNYLIPVDADIKSAGSIRFQTIGLDLVMDQMGDARNRANFVILDACRDNPFERRLRGDGGGRGLAAVNVDPASGFFIAFATAPGKTADDGEGNGVYTAALLDSLNVPGLKAEELFKRTREAVLRRTARRQTPWEQSSLVGDVIFNAKTPAPAPTAAAAAAPLPSLDPRQIDLAFWGSIQQSSDPEDYLAYLKKFPEGEFTMLAQRRLAALRGAAEPTAQRGTLGQVQRADRPAIGTVLWSSEKSGEQIVALTPETYTTETFGVPATVREIRSRKTGVPISSEMDLGGGVIARSTFVVTSGNPELLVTSKPGTPIRYSLQIQMQMRFLDGDTKRSMQRCDFEASVLDEESIEMNGQMVRGLAVEEKSRCDGRNWKLTRSYFVPNYGLFLAASAKVELPVSR